MTNIKKVYTEVFELLKTNENKKVSTLLPQLLELMESKQQSKCFITDNENNTTYVFCYYHKKWESIEHYGTKKHSKSGFNRMCKEGVNQWTKQQRLSKLGHESLVDDMIAGTLSVDDAQEEKETLELMRKEIKPRLDGHGFDNLEDI